MTELNEDQDVLYTEIIPSEDAKVPLWLKFFYIILPIWGVFWFYMYWNGSTGVLDPGYWQQLQRAANTTFPIENQTFNKKS